MSYIVKFILGKRRADKIGEEIYFYGDKKAAECHFNSFIDDDSNLYKRIELIELKNHHDQVINIIDYENDWRRWTLEDRIEYFWKDFEGSGSIEGIVTKVESDHLIVTTNDNMNLWVDDSTAELFIKLW